MGGKPTPGTKKDMRLSRNKPGGRKSAATQKTVTKGNKK
jgi:hypothetical protein